MELTLKGWLYIPCLDEELTGDEATGFHLPIETIRKKLQYMENQFGAVLHQSDFKHFLFNRMDKEVFASGSMQVEILQSQNINPDNWIGATFSEPKLFKKLVGAYSFNIQDYDNPKDRNEQYAGTLKTLCLRNALSSEYPQFGSLIYAKEPIKSNRGTKHSFKTSSKITDFQKGL